ncbi:hypothetical protein QFZ77_007412 [Paenibacillus sp. V4I3]|uniref:hypothetical protein n=1 Tax=unclassified Paenibacillus TaxID=185978 RepID=UPI002785614F|nr:MULTISPECIES: hypothetical protein [unclassified Paenibacillus]MDQ0878753.1 hypothetical protein [Paenibacillus sp. V4I3]MDQ0885394.1 hypothetical protein [Paenibacillus sp. V4I9]
MTVELKGSILQLPLMARINLVRHIDDPRRIALRSQTAPLFNYFFVALYIFFTYTSTSSLDMRKRLIKIGRLTRRIPTPNLQDRAARDWGKQNFIKFVT